MTGGGGRIGRVDDTPVRGGHPASLMHRGRARRLPRPRARAVLALLVGVLLATPAAAQTRDWGGAEPSATYRILDAMLEDAADDVVRISPRPTILSRQMAIVATAMFDAWACYDEKAVGTVFGDSLRRPAAERTADNKQKAMAFAAYRTIVDQHPFTTTHITALMDAWGYDVNDRSTDPATPQGIGNRCAAALLDARHHDGANQLGDEIGGNGEAYADYTFYTPVNTVSEIRDADRWQPIAFADGKGGTVTPNFLTPFWYRVRPFGLERADMFRPPPPPRVGSAQLKAEVDECLRFNATLTPEQKAIVEFMRDGPRSTGQSGHWLRFAQAVSRRDRFDMDRDVKLYFCVANTAMDAFIAAWESKRYYDSSRPWTLVRHYYRDQPIDGWLGPGKGVGRITGAQWIPYSPATFITPPFPATSPATAPSAAPARQPSNSSPAATSSATKRCAWRAPRPNAATPARRCRRCGGTPPPPPPAAPTAG